MSSRSSGAEHDVGAAEVSELPSIRSYRPDDRDACRVLWAELTEHHRRIYGDPTIGGEDPGAYFDTYLATPERAATWVAVVDGAVVGLTGLFDHGDSGEIEPVVVTEARRGQGIGRALIDHVIGEARARGYTYLAIRPVARNRSAIATFYAAGFQTLGGHVDLTIDLAPRSHGWLRDGRLHDLEFDY
jgi:GNAT superfamily N-acetyltransferase